MILFKATRAEYDLIHLIARRAEKYAKKHGGTYHFQDCDMDILACHANGNPLRLDELLTADEFNFSHDVWGIRRHINRETEKLGGCFSPRFSKP